ncbi:MAG: DEAD/DEAH box helicase [Akkermansiaceae bacterium]
MPSFKPKTYQQDALDATAAYFRNCQTMGNADYAFQETTKELRGEKQQFTPLKGFSDDMPYFCLRIPTGGGKTYLAAKSVAMVNNLLLHTEHSIILWLVPSTAIRSQTMEALKNLEHPYHHALREAGPVNVMGLDEAKSLSLSDALSSTVVIVATIQAFRREDTEFLKVFEANGSLMEHFAHLEPEQRENLLKDEDGTVPDSLVNTLRLYRPFLIVDEAHNGRTELSFDTLEKFRPSGIMELTATPDTDKTPSNVLHSVSAVELKHQEMIKLPIWLETEPDQQRCLAQAITQREELQVCAEREQAEGEAYVRPLVLIQSEARSSKKETRHADWVKQELMSNHNIPEEEIAVATGSEKGLETLEKEYDGGIFSAQCPVKFIITQKALAEGWDCAFAYILVSMAELKSKTAVEQLLGRILRQPQAKKRQTDALNRSYAYVVSKDFGETAKNLRDTLVDAAGFNRKEAEEFVAAQREKQGNLDLGRGKERIVFTPVEVNVGGAVDVSKVSKETKRKFKYTKKTQTLVINKPLSEDETIEIQQATDDVQAKEVIQQAGEHSRTAALEVFSTPSEKGLAFTVPQMEVYKDGELRLFNEPESLEYPWALPGYYAAPTKDQLNQLNLTAAMRQTGVVGIDDESGKMTLGFIKGAERDLGLSYRPEHWTETKLAAWFCRQLHDPAITHASKREFVSKWLSALIGLDGMDLARVNRQKFFIRNLLEGQINDLRKEAVQSAYQEFLFGEGAEERIRIGSEYAFEFHPDAYAPNEDYDGRFGMYRFEKHYYPRKGDMDSEEEFLCAQWLDQQPEVEFWVRNLVRKKGSSFFLPNTPTNFYPDFICKLTDGRVLVVEYKGAVYWDGAKANRKLGKLWAELSGGSCLFVMVKDKSWADIAAVMRYSLTRSMFAPSMMSLSSMFS